MGESFSNKSISIQVQSEQMFRAIPNSTPSLVDGSHNNLPGESLLTTREQHKQLIRNMNGQQENKDPWLDLSPVVYITANKTQQMLWIQVAHTP